MRSLIIISIIFFLSLFEYPAYASAKTDSLLTQLKLEMSRIKMYDGQKELRIKK